MNSDNCNTCGKTGKRLTYQYLGCGECGRPVDDEESKAKRDSENIKTDDQKLGDTISELIDDKDNLKTTRAAIAKFWADVGQGVCVDIDSHKMRNLQTNEKYYVDRIKKNIEYLNEHGY